MPHFVCKGIKNNVSEGISETKKLDLSFKKFLLSYISNLLLSG